ncbi:MAG: carboxypeptidase-like regulatory domain-containing protein [Candidatus Aminicenantes bacterium]|nr:carboxypeptidase-like regulatory domain-containing protein [Candidatus Aminicenantes bacterium]
MRKLLAVLFVCLLAMPLAAQQRTGNLYGTVVDQDGVPLPGVNVTLVSLGGAPMTAVSSNEGVFRFLSLPPSANYEVKAELVGFKTKIEQGVGINVGKNTNLEVAMEMGAIEEEVTVIATTPTVTPKRTEVSHTTDRDTLMALPSARDPWVIIQMVPSILMDRENIGGTDSGSQSGFVSKGENTSSWVMDGIQITDMTAIGSSTYFDFDIFDEISVTTGMPDVENRERAIVINMVTRRGQNKFGFGGRFYMTDEAWQMNPSGDDYEAVKEVFSEENGYPAIAGYNSVKNIKDFGFNMGGPLVQDKVWWWMSYGVQEINTFVITGTADNTQLNNYSGKLNFQLIPDNRAEIFLYLGDKKKQGINSDSYNPPGVNQHGQYHFGSPIFKIQDEHMFGDDLFISTRYGFVDSGFGRWPATDEEITAPQWYDYDNDIYADPWGNIRYSYYHYSGRPHQFGLLQGIYYNDNLLGASHELKVGLEINNNQRTYAGGNAGNFYFYHNYYTPQVDINLDGTRDIPDNWIRLNVDNYDVFYEDSTDRMAGYIQDIITFGRLTFNLQVRFDHVVDYLKENTTRSLYLEDVEGDWHDNYYEITQQWMSPSAITAISGLMTDRTSPEFSTPDAARFWSISPRIGLAYDLFGDGKTILKAAFAMYPGGPLALHNYSSSGVYPWMSFWWGDQAAGYGNGDWKVDFNELYWAEYSGSRKIYRIFDDSGNFMVTDAQAYREESLMWGGFDWDNPHALTPNNDTVDPNWKQQNDYDILVALEREIFVDFGIGIDFTYRWDERRSWELNYYPQYDSGGNITTFGERALLDPSDPNYFPVEYLDHKRSQDDYMQAGIIPGTVVGDSPGETSFSTDQAAGRSWYVLKDEPWCGYTKYGYDTNQPDRHNTYMGVDIRWNKRYSNNWMLSGSVTLQTQKQYYGDNGWLDPTNLWAYDGDYYTNSMGGGSGKLFVPMFTRWMFKLQGMYSLPFGFDVSFSLSGREGMIIDQYFSIVDYTLPNTQSQSASIQMQTNSDQARLGNIWVMNAKVQKRLLVGDFGSVWISCDIFNALNNQSMNRQRAANMGSYRVSYTPARYYPYLRSSEPNESLNPLILRFGVRFQF